VIRSCTCSPSWDDDRGRWLGMASERMTRADRRVRVRGRDSVTPERSRRGGSAALDRGAGRAAGGSTSPPIAGSSSSRTRWRAPCCPHRRPDVAPAAWRFRDRSSGEAGRGGASGRHRSAASTSPTRAGWRRASCAPASRSASTSRRAPGRVDGSGALRLACSPRRRSSALDRLAPEARRHAFLTYWTLKEAYLKAHAARACRCGSTGSGSSSTRARAPRIVFDPDMQDDAHRWQFAQFRPSEEHWMAVAIQRGTGPDVAISCRRVLPVMLGAR
jgi:hypothetical protein